MVCSQEFHHAAIFLKDAADKRFNFDRKVLAQCLAESRKQLRIGFHRIEIVEVQPLHRKTRDQAGRALIREHTTYLSIDDSGLREAAPSSDIEQLFIGALTP